MTPNLLKQFLDLHDYDVRKSHNGRWIDQKCAPDLVSFVADCVLNYIENGGTQPFESPMIWKNDYSVENVQLFFGKPDPLIGETLDEYNKFFRQPLKMLAAAGVLKENGKKNNAIQFSVENIDVLRYIGMRDLNSWTFINLYVEKSLKDSGLWDYFDTFFDEPTKDHFNELKEVFEQFCFDNTPINTKREADRIFPKVLNPLACIRHKPGTEHGHITISSITWDQLLYNKPNFRDEGKEKNVARRNANKPVATSTSVFEYNVNKAKTYLRKFNDKYFGGRSEYVDILAVHAPATHIHHIFPKSQYPTIAAFYENLIALTPAQHLQEAHLNGNTQIVSLDFQYALLILKLDHIKRNLEGTDGAEPFYSFKDFMFVLDTGMGMDYFEKIDENDFDTVRSGIDSKHAMFIPVGSPV